ncbi:MAG: histidine phosphatase family protein [Pseudomonadota bacterium]
MLWRHAKSSWSDPNCDDHDRPLNARGREAAPVMARWIVENDLSPALILSSTSLRTRETIRPLMKLLPGHRAPDFERGLYLANEAALMKRISAIPSAAKSAMIVGHNPGMEDVCERLISTVTPEAQDANTFRQNKFPTAACAVLSVEAERWRDGVETGFTLEKFVVPRDLMDVID